MENLEKNLLVNLIRQSQNDVEMNSNNKPKSFDDLTKLNQRINHLNQQVRFSLQTNEMINDFFLLNSSYQHQRIYYHQLIIIVSIH